MSRDKISGNFADVVPRHPSVRIDSTMTYPINKRMTPIEHVRIVDYIPPVEFQDFLDDLVPEQHTPQEIWDGIKKIIFDNWMPGKIHVIGSSSGYDSRIIAKAIKELSLENPGWIGETYFVELGGEFASFLQIMKILDLPHIVWEPKYDFDYFKNLSGRFNGLCAYPLNQWYDFFIKNWNEEDIQYISGYGGNVADAMNPGARYMKSIKKRLPLNGRLLKYFKIQYYYQLAAFKDLKYAFHPFWTWDYIRMMSGMDMNMSRTAIWLCDNFVSECKNVPALKILGHVTKEGYRTVDEKTLSRLDGWYRSTDYGRNHPVKPNSNIEYNLWWLQLCIASFFNRGNGGI